MKERSEEMLFQPMFTGEQGDVGGGRSAVGACDGGGCGDDVSCIIQR